ncbi:hypothetical protein [Myroides odoratus]|uniref:hypothetical protein n=1 Tax=Myroides odoratus TaxID=256 RepID=UPI003340D507
MKCTLLLLALLLLTSCATVLNEDSRLIYFYSSKNLEKIKVKDSIYELPVQLNLARSKEDLKVVMVTDSTDLTYTIKAERDKKFLYLNLTGVLFAPVNYAVDLTNHKRFAYPKSVYLDPLSADGMLHEGVGLGREKRGKRRYFRYEPDTEKGDLFFYGTFSPINYMSFDLPDVSTRRSGTGIGLGEIGASFYYTSTDYISLGVGAYSTVAFIPVFNRNILYAYTIKVANFHQFNRLNVGYGVFFGGSKNKVETRAYNYNEELDSLEEGRHTTVGLVGSVNFEVIKNFHVGVSYKPSLYRVSVPKKKVSNHLLSLELTYKLKLRGK